MLNILKTAKAAFCERLLRLLYPDGYDGDPAFTPVEFLSMSSTVSYLAA